MKNMFTPIALISAMAISSSAFAMQSMSEEDMSATTGQDGITIKITPPSTGITIDNVFIHDKDGINQLGTLTAANASAVTAGDDAYVEGAGGASAGAIVVKNIKVTNAPGTGTTVKIDADGGTGGTSPVLNINVNMGDTTIAFDSLAVGASARGSCAVGTSGCTARGIIGSAVDVVGSKDSSGAAVATELALGTTSMNIQLGTQASTTDAFIKMNGTISGGLSVKNIQVNDTSGVAADASGLGGTMGGSMGVGAITVIDTAGTNLTLNSEIDLNREGIVIKSLGGKMDIMMEDVRVGSSLTADNTLTFNDGVASHQTIGDVEISGISATGAMITISGH